MCNCPDSLILHTICKHIHLVQRAVSVKKENDTHFNGSDSPDIQDDNYNNDEIECLTGFAQMPNIADVGSICERVQGRVSDLIAAVERSINSADLLQLEKSLNSAHSLFLATEENGTAPKSLSPPTNAPSNKIMEKQPRFFSTKRKHNRVRSVRFVRPSRQEKEDIMENYKEKRKFANLLRVIAILKIE